jgi:hypothetical protein
MFQITARPEIFNSIDDMNKTAKIMHEELLEVIQSVSDASTSSDTSSVCTSLESCIFE